MLALIAGTGALPLTLFKRLSALGDAPLVCAMEGFTPEIAPQMTFRLEHLGTFLAALKQSGVTQICMAGAVRRPDIDPTQIDAMTAPLVLALQKAMALGDNGTLIAIIKLLEGHGFTVIGAAELIPDLLPPAGILTRAIPDEDHETDARLGDKTLREMGAADTGQACIIGRGVVIEREGPAGTDAMIRTGGMEGAILFKGPKPEQDRRADLPVIGPETALAAAAAGLAGIVIEVGGVMVLDLPTVRRTLDQKGMFLWVREWD